MPARGWHCLRGWQGWRPPASAPRQGGPTAGGEQGFTARNPPRLLGTVCLRVQGSKAPLQLERRCFVPKMLAEKLGGAAGQEGSPARRP